MTETPLVVCKKCRRRMWRVPQVHNVNWKGQRAVTPLNPNIKQLIDTAPERRERIEQEKNDR